MKIAFEDVQLQLQQVLSALDFSEDRAALCARLFAENSRDGVASHGLNRFPTFVKAVKDGIVLANAEPQMLQDNGCLQHWDGELAPGMYTATLAMQAAIHIAKEKGMGGVTVKNTNHWMRGGTYGWQAANSGCIAICATNTIANMPPWGSTTPLLGNNPLVIAIPRQNGEHVVLDMAMSQYSYGKLQQYDLKKEPLPMAGGFDAEGQLTTDAGAIYNSKQVLPVGFWKGSALSMVIDILVTVLSGGRSVAKISESGEEYGLSQLFLCLPANEQNLAAIEEIIEYTKSGVLIAAHNPIRYPGESTIANRKKSLQYGVEVNDSIWQQIVAL